MLNDDRPARIALMSCAHTHARSYASILDARDDVELVVADPDGYHDVDAQHIVGSYDEAWAFWPEGPDAIVVTSENVQHAPLVLDAARRGVHVLCEKPLATTVEDAEAMVEACAAAGVVLMTAFPVHFSPQIEAAREAIGTGALGRVLGVVGTNNGKLPEDRAWFTDPAASGGGALVDHTVHLAQVLDSILGEPTSIHAVANAVLAAEARHGEVETGGVVSLRYPDGTIATIDCSWSQPVDAPTWGGLTVHIAGTQGQLDIDAFAQHVGGFGQWHAYGIDLDARLIETFLGAVRDGVTREPSGDVGLRTTRVVAAAQRSAATGETITLESGATTR